MIGDFYEIIRNPAGEIYKYEVERNHRWIKGADTYWGARFYVWRDKKKRSKGPRIKKTVWDSEQGECK